MHLVVVPHALILFDSVLGLSVLGAREGNLALAVLYLATID